MEAVQATLRAAAAAGESVIAQAGRSAIETGNPPARYDVALDLSALDRVVAHEPEDFTITLQAGMRFGTLQSLLAQHGQFLPLDPAQAATSTIGGVVARGRGGLRRAAFGEVRDWLIGCTVVLSDGRLVHGGGRVVKNVSGYDLPKLFAGSWGTLGCIVELSFKLRPLPARDETLRIGAHDFADAVRLGREVSRRVLGLQAVVALDAATAAAAGLPSHPMLLVRAGGMQPVVHATLAAAIELSAPRDAELTRSDEESWRRLADETGAAAAPVVLRIGCPPPAIETVADMATARFADASCLAAVDGGVLWLRLPAPHANMPQETADAVQSLREAVSKLGGVLTLESGQDASGPAPTGQITSTSTIDAWGADVPGLPIMRRIKAELDPTQTMSPGRFVGGL